MAHFSKQGVPPKVLAALRNLHEGMEGYVQYMNKTSRRFLIHTGVWQLGLCWRTCALHPISSRSYRRCLPPQLSLPKGSGGRTAGWGRWHHWQQVAPGDGLHLCGWHYPTHQLARVHEHSHWEVCLCLTEVRNGDQWQDDSSDAARPH